MAMGRPVIFSAIPNNPCITWCHWFLSSFNVDAFASYIVLLISSRSLWHPCPIIRQCLHQSICALECYVLFDIVVLKVQSIFAFASRATILFIFNFYFNSTPLPSYPIFVLFDRVFKYLLIAFLPLFVGLILFCYGH